MKIRKTIALLLAALSTLFAGCAEKTVSGGAPADSAVHQDSAENTVAPASMTTMEAVRDMGLGINLGNTFEATAGSLSGGVKSFETSWGSPEITQEIIQGYKNEGFGVLRVPVAWSNMMEADYTIYPEYLSRVHEVVRWALDAGLYVILNIHWDGGWWDGFASEAKKDKCMEKYTRIWEQITDEFGAENEYLVYESLNEEGAWPSLWDRYSGDDSGKQKAYDLLLEINQKFVDIVRGKGGCDANRHLLIAGYATDIDCTCDEMFRMPEDPQNRCAVSVHYYTPSTFCILEQDADWGKARSNWGSPRDLNELKQNFEKLTERFVSKGVPVIIGEFGCPTKNKEAASIQKFLSAVTTQAIARAMCPVLWSTPGNFYDRNAAKMYDPALRNAMFTPLQARSENTY
ncbi:MAG: glycoside hydrolase family 5 protein [Oscillospiraceae bacterium]|nr:glycoside hydrolase family 5 protein [Oscillospiraceae bacterium]